MADTKGVCQTSLSAVALRALVYRIFVAAGLVGEASEKVADALVDAELQGLPSHGVLLVPMYVERIRAGSVSLQTCARVVSENGAAAVLDAGHALGILTAEQAMDLAVDLAQAHGLGAVAVRHAFHFGMAGRYASAAAAQGCVGIAMCNTRPLMPAPGGAEPVVGNNPLAVAMPSAGSIPVVLDMALSEVAMGKVRLAAAEGRAIPEGWAAGADGLPTTDPQAAIAGMLLPAGGPKGFGLAFMIDLLCGALSEGAWGARVAPLYGDPAIPYDCSHFFLAIDVAHFRDLDGFRDEVEAAAVRVRGSRKAPGVTRIYSPGEMEWERRRCQDDGGAITVPAAVADSLRATAESLGIAATEID